MGCALESCSPGAISSGLDEFRPSTSPEPAEIPLCWGTIDINLSRRGIASTAARMKPTPLIDSPRKNFRRIPHNLQALAIFA
jgi:hypothetical protein